MFGSRTLEPGLTPAPWRSAPPLPDAVQAVFIPIAEQWVPKRSTRDLPPGGVRASVVARIGGDALDGRARITGGKEVTTRQELWVRSHLARRLPVMTCWQGADLGFAALQALVLGLGRHPCWPANDRGERTPGQSPPRPGGVSLRSRDALPRRSPIPKTAYRFLPCGHRHRGRPPNTHNRARKI